MHPLLEIEIQSRGNYMAVSALRSWLVASLVLSAALCIATDTILANSPAPIDKTQSCASQEYKQLDARSDPVSVPVGRPTLLVVPGNKTLRLNTASYVGMGRQITVCIMGLHDWIYVQNQHPSELRLSIGGHVLKNVPPSGIGPSEQEYLNFVLHLDASDSDDWKAWAAIVDASRHEDDGGKALITVATVADNQFFDSTAYSRVVTGSDSWYWILALFVVMIAILLYLAGTTDLLRYTLSAQPTPPQRSPFSLGLVQMAFWFCLSLAAYIYICLMTRQVHVPMGSVLGLLGISATTGLAAVFVDKQKNAATEALVAERAALSARIKELSAAQAPPGSPADVDLLQKKNRLAQVEALLAQAPSDTPATSKGFLRDILSDGENISFHRFQMVVWTLVLGIIFAWSVYRNMTMPEFDASLLTLMGISSGTYVGFKFPEKLKTGDSSTNFATAPVAA